MWPWKSQWSSASGRWYMSMVLMMVTALSVTIAVLASAVAWRLVSADRRRSDARVRRLAAEIHGDARRSSEPESTSPTAFPVGAAVGVCAAIVAAIAVAVGAFSADRDTPAGPAPSSSAGQARPLAAPASAQPFELVALSHDRSLTALTVRGIVRNPLNGASRVDIAAIVHGYDDRGELVASGRAAVGSALSPGEERTFVVAVPDAAHVERYRVSFRVADAAVPHVDRRAGA